ncbi:hypothetical protein L218DRAFT_996361 [Marasmius fiardii PR-910]|nr:hypothetical protein L218DRAFT_996361 [Marasmius fiardii PR-910]
MPDILAAESASEMWLKALDNERIISYVDVCSSTLLVYDVLTNLDIEIEHIWMRKWSYFTVLYVVQRYLPIFDTAMVTLREHFAVNLSVHDCHSSYYVSGWSNLVGIMLSEIVLTLRVWAVWKRNISVAIGLVLFLVACWTPCTILIEQFLHIMEFNDVKLRGCFLVRGSETFYLCWVMLMVYDTGTFVLIFIPGVKAYQRNGRSELVRTIYQDGVIYFAFISLLSIINVIVIIVLPSDLVLLLTSFERVMHSLLTSRAILHIRQVCSQHSTHPTMSQVSQVRFARNEHEDPTGSSVPAFEQGSRSIC